MNSRIGVVLIVWVVTLLFCAWFFRYEPLAPVVFQDFPSRDNPTGRDVVVCTADRWTRDIRCKTVSINAMTPEEFVGK